MPGPSSSARGARASFITPSDVEYIPEASLPRPGDISSVDYSIAVISLELVTEVNPFSHEIGFCDRSAATLLQACVILSKSTHPFRPAHARCGDISFCRFTDLRTASVPAFQPAQTFRTCLTQSGPCCFFLLFFC